jgi:hypothetical protein
MIVPISVVDVLVDMKCRGNQIFGWVKVGARESLMWTGPEKVDIGAKEY